MNLTIERFFDYDKVDALPLAMNIKTDPGVRSGSAGRSHDLENRRSTKPEQLDKEALLRDSERV
jgi:hypothetical protein